MARFAGSRAPQISGFEGVGRSGFTGFQDLNLDPGTSNAGSAANAVSVGSIYGTLRDKAPKYDEIANTAQTIRANEIITGMKAEAQMTMAGITAAANVAKAEATAKAYDAQASAAKTGGFASALGGIASAAIGLSDESTKHTIDRIDDALEILRNLKPVSFFYKEEYSASPERMHYGFIAQEFKEQMPDATYFDDSIGKMCIDTGELIGLLVRANQQLETRIARLEAKQALVAV